MSISIHPRAEQTVKWVICSVIRVWTNVVIQPTFALSEKTIQIEIDMETVKLSNDVEMPQLGYGVYQVSPSECERCVMDAISVGYRMIDTAQAYFNEEGVGNAIRKCYGFPMPDTSGRRPASTSRSANCRPITLTCCLSINPSMITMAHGGPWRKPTKQANYVNFYPDRFIDLAEFSEIPPMVNQVETHVFNQQIEAQQIMQQYGTHIMSWGPFAEGRNNFFGNETLIAIGAKYNKSAAQTALRYLLLRGVIVIPKSVRKERMEQNIDVFDFTLDNADMQAIRQLDLGHSLFFSHYDPQTVKWLCNYGKSK